MKYFFCKVRILWYSFHSTLPSACPCPQEALKLLLVVFFLFKLKLNFQHQTAGVLLSEKHLQHRFCAE